MRELKNFETGLGSPDRKLRAFIRRLRKWRGSIVPFLHDEEVPADNNGSERGIRNVKVKTKISGQFRTPGSLWDFGEFLHIHAKIPINGAPRTFGSMGVCKV